MSIDREAGPLKWNLNTILAVSGFTLTLLLQIIGGTIIFTTQSNKVETLTSQVQELKVKVAEIIPLTTQVTTSLNNGARNEKAIEALDMRMNRIVENLGAKMDNVLESVNTLAKNVAVLASQTERQMNQKTDFKMPIVRP